MRTKKFLSVAAFIVCGLVCVNSVNAQTLATATDPVTVNIKLNPIQAIEVNAIQKTVDLVYNSIQNYEQGVTSGVLADHLTVYSAGKFVVSVKTDGNFINGGSSINAVDVTVKATRSAAHSVGELTDVNLSASDQPLITSASKGGNGLKYNIEYDNLAGKNFKYAGDEYYTEASGVLTYTAQVTYTIAPN